MVKKMKSGTTDAGSTSSHQASHLAAAVKDSAQQIWLAGMGAFAKAQEEGGKVFEALVKEGTNLQKKTQGMAEEKIGEVTGKMTAMADTVSSKAGQNWDKLESIFEARTAKALGRLGVPTAKDVQSLTDRVDALAAAVAKLAKGTASKADDSSAEVAKATKAAKAVRSPRSVKADAVQPAAKVARARRSGMKAAADVSAAVPPVKRAPRRKAAAA